MKCPDPGYREVTKGGAVALGGSDHSLVEGTRRGRAGCGAPARPGQPRGPALAVRQNAFVSDPRQPAYVLDLLGELTPYERAVDLQLDLAAARSQGAMPDTIVLCEHPPTLTLGRSSDAELELPQGEQAIRELGWELVRSRRGGRSTWHGPGQLVCYPILDLRNHGKDLRAYSDRLERAIVQTLAGIGVVAHAGETRETVGVWAGDRKLASLGVHADRWIVTHGLAINVDCDVTAFDRFNACGLEHTRFSSVALELGQPCSVGELRDPLLAALAEEFSLALSKLPAGVA